MEIILFFVALFASIIGAICGIGGGVIIKPVLDAFGWMSVSSASFLSGCTVLSMTAYAVLRERRSNCVALQAKKLIPISIGAAIGGIAGKALFQWMLRGDSGSEAGIVQAVCLIVLVVGTIVYTLVEHRIHTFHLQSVFIRWLVGVSLGTLSAFLGIGGGPFNLVALSFFFSLRDKEAVVSSLFIILISQISSLLMQFATRTVPDVSWTMLVAMICGGIFGGMIGRMSCNHLSVKNGKTIFISLNLIIIGISCWNIYRFLI
jgi:uncharacterized membrane protein YfcA